MEGSGRGLCCPVRYYVAILGALGLLATMGVRKCFALIMTHLTVSPSRSAAADTRDIAFTSCTVLNSTHERPVEVAESTVFLLHTAYFVGLVSMKMGGVLLATKFSPVRLTGCAVLTSSLLTISLPRIITTSVPFLFGVRLLQGLLDAVQQPCTVGVLSSWSPRTETGRLFSIFYTGGFIAPAVAAIFSAVAVCYVSWESSLYFYGVYGMVWSIVWATTVYHTPADHPSLSALESSLYSQHKTRACPQQGSIPWCKILTSPPVWSVFVGYFCHTMVYSAMVVGQPQYLSDSFQMNIADAGALSTLPHLGVGVACLLGGTVSDRLLHVGLTTTAARKLVYTVGKLGEGLCLLSLFFVHDWRLAISLLSVGLTLGGLSESGYLSLSADMAPQYAGAVTACMCFGGVGAIVSSVLSSFVCTGGKGIAGWQTLFLVMGLVDLVAVCLFDLLTKAEVLPWAAAAADTTQETDTLLQQTAE